MGHLLKNFEQGNGFLVKRNPAGLHLLPAVVAAADGGLFGWLSTKITKFTSHQITKHEYQHHSRLKRRRSL